MLTTIRTHMEAMGKTAAAEIIRLLSGEHGRIERIPGSMVVRRSCTLRGWRQHERNKVMKQTTTLFAEQKKTVSVQEIAWDEKETERERDLINLYPDVQYQTLRGFGGAFTDAAGYVYAQMPQEKRQELIRAYYSADGLRYSLGRTSIDRWLLHRAI